MKEKLLSGLKWFFKSYIWLGVLLLAIDIITKQIILGFHALEGDLISDWGFVRIRFILNRGAAFGMGTGNAVANRVLYLVIASLISIGLVTYLIIKRKDVKAYVRASLIMVVTGAIGNMIDRIFYAPEFAVVDWIDFYGIWKFNFNIADAEEEIQQEEGEYDGSVITLANEQEPYNPYIQIHRFSKDLPHLTNTLNITNLSMRGWDVRGHIESIEQDDNVTIYHCRNSLFMFKVEIHAHILFWYDENTPIYKE